MSRPPSSGRVRVGVAGLGAVAQAVHLPLLARLADVFEIGAICDLSAGLRDALGERYNVGADVRFDSVERLLDEAPIDGLILLTSGSHGAAALAALDRDIPILCEKPLAYTVAEADRLAASPNADRLLLGYMKVFDPAVVEAGRVVADPGAGLGERRAIEVAVLHPTSNRSSASLTCDRRPPTSIGRSSARSGRRQTASSERPSDRPPTPSVTCTAGRC